MDEFPQYESSGKAAGHIINAWHTWHVARVEALVTKDDWKVKFKHHQHLDGCEDIFGPACSVEVATKLAIVVS